MSLITIREAETQLSQLIQRAMDGEEIVIAKSNQPLVRLQVIQEELPARAFGGSKDLILNMDDTFDDELEDFAAYGPPITRILSLAEDPAQNGKK